MSKESQISNLRGLWQRIKGKQTDANTATLNAAKAYTDTKFGQIHTFQKEVVNELPAQGDAKTLYFVPADGTNPASNIYNEFIWVESKNSGAGGYEQVGSTAYTPDHSIENDSDLGKLVLTIGDNKYVIDRTPVVAVAAPTLHVGSTSGTDVLDNDEFTNTILLALKCSTSGADIYYTTTSNGDEPAAPTKSSSKYSSAISFAQDTSVEYKTYKIKARAFLNGAWSADTLYLTFKVYRQVEAPVFGVDAGTYNSTQSVTLTRSGAIIKYAVGEGSAPLDPTAEGASYNTYSSAINVTKTNTYIKAYASADGWRDSAVVMNTYVLQVAQPTASLDSLGKYASSRTITVTNNDANATVKWRKDSGSWDTLSGSTKTITEDGTYQFKAVRDNWTDSPVTSVTGVQVGKKYIRTLMTATTTAPTEQEIEAVTMSTKTDTPSTLGSVTFDNSSSSVAKQMWICVPKPNSVSHVQSAGWNQNLTRETTSNYNLVRIGNGIDAGTSVTYSID